MVLVVTGNQGLFDPCLGVGDVWLGLVLGPMMHRIHTSRM